MGAGIHSWVVGLTLNRAHPGILPWRQSPGMLGLGARPWSCAVTTTSPASPAQTGPWVMGNPEQQTQGVPFSLLFPPPWGPGMTMEPANKS